MKLKLTILMAALCFAASVQMAFAADPYINKASLEFYLQAHQDKPEWRWSPKATFRLNGKITDGSVIEIQYTAPNGKPLVIAECKAEPYSSFSDNKSQVIEDCGKEIESDKATNLTGVFAFSMSLKNELEGQNIKLFSGKFKVDKILYNPSGGAEFNKQFYYTANRDWRLQMGHFYFDWYTGNPMLAVELFFKGPKGEGESTAHLFYNGKQVAKASSGSNQIGYSDAGNMKYFRRKYTFDALGKTENHENWGIHKLFQNPGDYEVKVMLSSKVVRTMKLKIDKDGNPIDDADVIGKNKIGANGIIVPVTVLGDLDAPWDKLAAKNEGIWGNPLAGLALP